MEMQEKIKFALENTEILAQPRELLSTYESTTVHYYMLSIPFYLEFEGKKPDAETVVREGRITWQKPRLITPGYIMRMEGFSEEARKALEMIAVENADIAMLLYNLKFVKDYDSMEIVSNSIEEIKRKIEADIEKKQNPFCAIIKGIDEFWDVSLTKFIYELMIKSAYYSNMPEYSRRSYLDISPSGHTVLSRDKSGIPVLAKNEIESLFKKYKKGLIDARTLKDEIDRWGLFEYYQDRFFNLFRL